MALRMSGRAPQLRLERLPSRDCPAVANLTNVTLEHLPQRDVIVRGQVYDENSVVSAAANVSQKLANFRVTTAKQISEAWMTRLSPPCPGDLNGDAAVSLSDLTVLLAHFGTAGGATSADGDMNVDGPGAPGWT